LEDGSLGKESRTKALKKMELLKLEMIGEKCYNLTINVK
jgi:hypothetical protein